MLPFMLALAFLGVIFLSLFLYARRNTANDEQLNRLEFLDFQRSYLLVYCLAVAGDWLQGPHVYALYQSYWMDKHQIELLFIAGFGSSLIFGTFIGSIADKFGRKANCLLYTLLYGIGCLTKHFANFNILLFGRLMGGIATSILFSAFESWLVYEHKRRDFNDIALKQIFSNATLANSLIAILAGVVAQTAANMFGYVAPFDCALLVLAMCAAVCLFTWCENYGDEKAGVEQSFLHAFRAICDDRRILYLGLVQSLFEGSMYVFVLEWTPALNRAANSEEIPHGYIFAGFMLSVMAGSSMFNVLCQRYKPESFMRFVLLVSACTLVTPILLPYHSLTIFVSFALFELCVGIFWPAMGFLRSQYIPEQTRSTTMNFFRVPLNLLVISLLWQNLSMDAILQFCVFFLLLAALFQQLICKLTGHELLASRLSAERSDRDKLLDEIEKEITTNKEDIEQQQQQHLKERTMG